ncbi:ABC-three component system middle component 2 [Xenorhabdus bovienii]|uniref:ABC-three component system middle component 2 n=1 Tax=Xenorhabdus bovienii TaxID=40576 RepID=UPI00237CDF1D|nr:ABC-three component system middle component 2 [Xenorhabdus bovienii]MDE1484527.1 threonine transporter [Xenorhabdus bovienii]MDE9434212.1 threonine transporter [Xenorhabdus bovienii]MDE9443695.1 threonine transporter [Xenorhabdus bovienii]MDE9491838.1 threonine transporter [Xenorhabdus bovienii]MDE9508219.1 threonine transporter [Xenorhabdus bovienii]
MNNKVHPEPFNSPFEAGIRSLAILVSAFPESYDLQRLVEMDYLVVHSGDANGPDSLHAPLPMRAGELLVRHSLIEKGLMLMMSRGLVQRVSARDGFNYLAGESAAPFIASLTTEYSRRMKVCAEWATYQFKDLSTLEIRSITHRLFQQWSSQFQIIQSSGGQQ